MTNPTAKQTFFGVQALRGLAAALVVVHHSTQLWDVRLHAMPAASGWGNGASGVDIFFVISGFVMTLTALGRRRLTATDFLRRRLLRIVPLYWICTLATMAALALRYRHNLSGSGDLGFTHILASFLFLPTVNALGHVAPVLAVGWTLSYEMFFYLLFALALALRTRVPTLRFLAVLMILLSIVGAFYRDTWPPITVLLQPIILEFIAGVWLGHAVLHGRRWPLPVSAILAVLGLLALLLAPMGSGTLRPFFWGIPAFALVASAVMAEGRVATYLPRWALRVGDASYSLYLSHLFVLNLLTSAAAHVHLLVRSQTAFILTALLGSTIAAILLYRFVEAPLTVALGQYFHLRPPSVIVQGEHIETAQ